MERTHTLPSGLPFWELESIWNLNFLENDFKGQNSLDWKVSHTIEKLLKPRHLKWAYMTRLNTYSTIYDQKKGRESKCQFDSRPLKVRNHFELHEFGWRVTYHWKDLNKSYNFSLNFISIRGLHKELQASKVPIVLISKISRLPSWESWDKMTFWVRPMANQRKYYKGEGGGFPQVQVVMNFGSLCMPVAHMCTKSISTTQ
jgi:hypothetical protein